jgi:hypothetical protein
MGAISNQPAKSVGQMTVDPLERMQQKMAGRTHGGVVEGLTKKKPSILSNYGMK